MCCCTVSDFFLYLLAVLLPPAAVIVRSGFASKDFLLSVLLTLFGYVFGVLHALYYVTITSPRRNEEYRFYYQQGWEDRERNAGLTESDTPLLQQGPSSLNTLNGEYVTPAGDVKVSPPPPYQN